MVQNNTLPEGTDKIISGSSTIGSSDSELTDTGSTTRVGDSEFPTKSVGAIVDKVRESGGKIGDQAAGKARDLLGQGLERSAEALSSVSRMVGDTATGIDERLGQEYGNYARKAAQSIDQAANSLAGKSADELIEDTRDFVRKSPGIALAGAAIVGFALARLVKAGLDDGKERSKS